MVRVQPGELEKTCKAPERPRARRDRAPFFYRTFYRYAALTLMPDDAEVLTVELKVNVLAPASGDRLVAEGEVVRAGRTLTVCRGDAHAEQGAERVHAATMLATMVRRRAAVTVGGMRGPARARKAHP